jgi:hypothetical protein
VPRCDTALAPRRMVRRRSSRLRIGLPLAA